MKPFLYITTLLISMGCGRNTHWVKTKSHVYSSKDHRDTLGTSGQKIQVQYLGCGGLYIKSGQNAIMFDPFFSNPSFINVMFSSLSKSVKIKSNPKFISKGINEVKKDFGDNAFRNVTGLISAHSHYDHLMDFPALFDSSLINKDVCKVYTNTSGITILKNAIANPYLVNMENLGAENYNLGTWIYTSLDGKDTIRILPIKSSHNAHFGWGGEHKNPCKPGFKHAAIKLYNGTTSYPDTNFSTAMSKTNVNYWKEGQTFSFLVDVIKNQKTVFRIFIQSSSCDENYGLPPVTILREAPVNLAIMGVASYQFSCNYPKNQIQFLNPQKVLFIHWEDFFLKYNPGKSIPVIGTDLKLLLGEGYQERVGMPLEKCKMPEIGVTTTYDY